MDIFAALRADHQMICDLLDRLIQMTSENDSLDSAPEIFHDLKVAIVSHNRAEEVSFYQVLESVIQSSSSMESRTSEHQMVEELLQDLEKIDPKDFSWGDKLAILKNQLDYHIQEEETQLFPLVRPHFDDEQRGRMALEFEQMRSEIVEGLPDYPKGKSTLNPAGLDLLS